jgi:hypothetical protein
MTADAVIGIVLQKVTAPRQRGANVSHREHHSRSTRARVAAEPVTAGCSASPVEQSGPARSGRPPPRRVGRLPLGRRRRSVEPSRAADLSLVLAPMLVVRDTQNVLFSSLVFPAGSPAVVSLAGMVHRPGAVVGLRGGSCGYSRCGTRAGVASWRELIELAVRRQWQGTPPNYVADWLVAR